MKTISNMTDLRKEMCSTLVSLKAKRIEPQIAQEINNAAGKIISSVKVEMDYARQCKVLPELEFMEK